jgi:N-acetylmuramoyl-L-alanine amidase
MRQRNVSAHVVVDRDGKILQCRPFTTKAAHAGPSKWRDPQTGQSITTSLNACSIGIEIANAGDEPGVIQWAKKNTGATSIQAKHRNGGPMQEWEAYSQAQLRAVFDLTKALVDQYKLHDVTGHDCISPGRKNDPGPAFPMQDLREFCGFSGLPVVFKD